ncbi:mechanosensitive ion channel [Verticiella sediminum]|uniref:Mechanosensitive ion channel n=1 Tax=Verticiella sediminum TaxID=1247510 RepID=A0A556ANM0_9BURK|nr:mechanosensitive ion channel domain-containing protein [Verticiella sediminum]TSH94477.1 mechanosensitive ion channel [Verticiella sediminum]
MAWLVVLCSVCFLQTAVAAEASASAPSAAANYGTLADVLENDATRERLIEQLRTLAAEQPPAGAAAPATSAAADPASATPPATASPAQDRAGQAAANNRLAEVSLAGRIADGMQSFVGDLIDDAGTAAVTLRDLFTGEAQPASRVVDWPAMLGQLAVVAVATIVAFLILRALATGLFRRLDQWVVHRGKTPPPAAEPGLRTRFSALGSRVHLWSTRVAAIVLALVVDVAVILLAGAVGYGTAVFMGVRGFVGIFDMLFVNAFVAVEIARALVRMVFATRFENLRLLPMADDVAKYWDRWLERLVSIAGYGLLVVVPVLGAMLSPAIGQLAGFVIMLCVYVYAVSVIWRNRKLIRDRITRRAQHASTAFFGTLLRVLARTWHVLAIAYFTVLLVASQVDPAGALPFMAAATAQTVLAVGIGMLISAILTLLLSRHIRLSADLNRRLPMLEARLNSYVPATLKGLRLVILVAVALIVLDAWHAFNLSAWVASERGAAFIGTVVRVAIILFVAMAVWTVIASVIEHRLNLGPDAAGKTKLPSAREKTLLSLFRNASLVVIVTMTVLVLLSQIGINIGPLIAGAGVVGLAIGFGAQKLVQDVITGVFIQLENGMNQNDVVEVAGIFGTVEKLTIRSVGIRTLDGGYHLIPFSSVDKVSNHMRDFSYHWGEYTVAHRENVDDVFFHLRAAYDEMQQDEVLAPELLEDITIAGVTKLDERGFTVRVLIKTTPGMQWAVQRAYNRLVKKHFNAAGIELPYPHTVVYFGQDKNGQAPAANVHTVEAREVLEGNAPGNGAMFRPLAAAQPAHAKDKADVLGNELDTVYDEDGQRKEPPAPQPERT